MRHFQSKWYNLEPLACKRFLNDFDETLTFLEFDQKLQKRIRTTNYLDRYLERTKKKNTFYEFLYRSTEL
jgi:transposase-like protein